MNLYLEKLAGMLGMLQKSMVKTFGPDLRMMRGGTRGFRMSTASPTLAKKNLSMMPSVNSQTKIQKLQDVHANLSNPIMKPNILRERIESR